MANQVFANGMEVSCKAADGKSICAFPDVCMTPPQTPATPPGVPIPYPNTGMASDTSDGSTTVKISGQEVMLKNKSYFKKSTGDEAGCAPKKGVMTSKITGKVYFTAWSMDVKIEGENVVRNLDLTTHNHGSNTNTPPWPYTDDMAAAFNAGGVCERMEHLKLRRFSDKCPGGTPHHLIPDRCTQGIPGYSHGAAPCVCVSKGNQHQGTHRDCHAFFDRVDDHFARNNKPFPYRTAKRVAAASAGEAMDPPRRLTRREKRCLAFQMDQYYKKDPNGPCLSEGSPMNTTAKSGGNMVVDNPF